MVDIFPPPLQTKFGTGVTRGVGLTDVPVGKSVVGDSVVSGSAVVVAVQFPESDDTYCSIPVPVMVHGPAP